MASTLRHQWYSRWKWLPSDGEEKESFTSLEDVPERVRKDVARTYRWLGCTGQERLISSGVSPDETGGGRWHWITTGVA